MNSVKRALKDWKKKYLLINNTGGPKADGIDEEPEEDWLLGQSLVIDEGMLEVL